MKSRIRQNYSVEFKSDALELLRISNKGITQVARELGVSVSSLRNWKKSSLENTPMLPMSKKESTSKAEELYAENQKLRKEIDHLRRQREILKKAASILAEDPQLGLQ